MPVQQAQQTKWKRLVEIFSKLNVYDSETTDPILLRKEILSTRLFIFLFITSLCIVTIYASSVLQQKTERVLVPTENQYRKILQTYSATLACPCSKISIPFNKFAIISPVFHQVCQSDFVSQEWIDFIFHPNRSSFWPMDIRNSLSSLWQIIRVFCGESTVTFNNALQDFQDSSLISSIILSPELLETELQAFVNTLQQTAADSLLRPSKGIHILTKVDDLMTGLSTNFIAIGKTLPPGSFIDAITTRTMGYKNMGANEFCHCQSEESCPYPAGIYFSDTWETLGLYDLNQIIPNEIIPGLILDCSPMQNVLGSTLECFYNQTCLNILISSYPQNFNATALSLNKKSHFQSVDRIEKLIEAIFIEEIFHETNFTSYYHNCQPSYCIYTYTQRFDWSYVLATIISLFGGLNIALHLICPYIIELISWCKRRASSNEPQDEAPIARVPVKVMIQHWIRSVFDTVLNLNLFTSKSRRPIQLHRGRLATRLYLIIFPVILIVLTLYTAVSVRSVTEITVYPSEAQFKYLQDRYPATLQCPCSVISIPHKKIIEVRPSLHQICSSDFVKKSWYQKLGVIPVFDDHGNSTYSLSWYFRSIAAICELSQLLLDQSVRRFNSIVYVSAKVTPSETFASQMSNIISGLKLATKNEFNYTMELIRAILHANGYISGIPFQNTILFLLDFGEALGSNSLPTKVVSVDGFSLPEIGICFCAREGDCHIAIGDRYNHFRTCSSLRTTMRLSLEDFYGTGFISSLEHLVNPEYLDLLRNTSNLDPTKPTRFETNATLETIFQELMIEDWNAEASFSRFYEMCRPESCSYSYDDRPTLAMLITVISGIVGGLNILLRLIISVTIRMIIRQHQNSQTDSSTNINRDPLGFTDYLRRISRKFRKAIFSLNLFDDKPNIVDTQTKEVVSTWLYLSLLISTIIVATFYISLISYSSNVVVNISSLSMYKTLLASELNSFRCPCTQISIPYKDFVSIDTTFHQVCDSDFVKQSWIYALFDSGDWFWYEIVDIRIRGAASFALLSSLCKLSKTTIFNGLDQFLNETFVNTYMLPENEFHSRIDASIDLFEKNTPAEFATVLRVLNQLTHASTFVSTYLLNWEWELPVHETSHRLQTRPVDYDGCSCGTRSDCGRRAGIYSIITDGATQITPGIFVGCSSIATLLQSTLECFYQQSCIDTFIRDAKRTLFRINMSIEVTALDPEIASHYKMNTSVKEMVELLFIENWRENVSYEAFYNKCAPVQCSYIYEKGNDLLYISTTILSIYGGATAILRLLVPYLVSLLTNAVNHRCMSAIRPSP